MGIMVYSLFWVMQDLYHQPNYSLIEVYYRNPKIAVEVTRSQVELEPATLNPKPRNPKTNTRK